MGRWEELFNRLVWSFGEKEFKRYIKGYLVDSRRLAQEIDYLDLQLIADYVPGVFWRRLKKRNLPLYAVDILIEYFFSGRPPKESSVEGAENLLILNSLFWERFGKRRPKQEYYLSMGAYLYRLSYQNAGAAVFRLMELYYRPLVEELRKMKGG